MDWGWVGTKCGPDQRIGHGYDNKLTSDICEELCIEVTEVKHFGRSEGVVPPVADAGLVDEKGPLADLIGSMPPVMGTKCHPKLSMGIDPLVILAIFSHHFEQVVGSLIELWPGQFVIIDDRTFGSSG